MKRLILTAVVFFLSSGALVVACHACSCSVPDTPADRFVSADAVFAGTIVEEAPLPFEDPEQDGIGWYSIHYGVAVEDVWKGDVSPRVALFQRGGFDCQYRFEVGETYLIYTFTRPHPINQMPLLVTFLCQGNRRIDDAQEDLDWLGAGRSPNDPVRGFLKNYPNPFTAQTQLVYAVPADGFVHIDLYDATGARVRRLIAEKHAEGLHTLPFEANGLAPGIYLCHLRVQHGPPAVRALVVTR